MNGSKAIKQEKSRSNARHKEGRKVGKKCGGGGEGTAAVRGKSGKE
jgi:hypothetical protein